MRECKREGLENGKIIYFVFKNLSLESKVYKFMDKDMNGSYGT